MAGKYEWISLAVCTALPFVVWKSVRTHVFFGVAWSMYITQYHGKRHQISEQHRSRCFDTQFEGRNLLLCVIDFTLMLSTLALSIIFGLVHHPMSHLQISLFVYLFAISSLYWVHIQRKI